LFSNLAELVDGLSAIVTSGTVIVCVGSDLRGDDAAGVAIGRALAETELPWPVFLAQTAPESFLQKITSHQPETVIVIDALGIEGPPGSIAAVEAGDSVVLSPSTHGPGAAAFFEALQILHPCRCVVLGIQPKQMEFGRDLSEPVRESVDLIVEAFRKTADLA
jgi:hydrogenase 3 maturation protease